MTKMNNDRGNRAARMVLLLASMGMAFKSAEPKAFA